MQRPARLLVEFSLVVLTCLPGTLSAESGTSPKKIKAPFGILTEPLTEPPKPKPLPISPEESLASIRVPDGYKVELVVAEPDVMDPVAIDWDGRGRLWVVDPGESRAEKLRIDLWIDEPADEIPGLRVWRAIGDPSG